MYQISAKSNNPRPSYNDLKVNNVGLSAILNLTGNWFSQFSNQGGLIMHLC